MSSCPVTVCELLILSVYKFLYINNCLKLLKSKRHENCIHEIRPSKYSAVHILQSPLHYMPNNSPVDLILFLFNDFHKFNTISKLSLYEIYF